MVRAGERKQRSDKKKEVKPSVPIDLKDAIYRLGYITHTPVKDVCEKLCIALLKDDKAISDLSMYFQRDILIRSTLYLGNSDNNRIDKREPGYKERITIKFKQVDFEIIYALGFAMGCSPSRVVALLLHQAFKEMRVVNQYIKTYLEDELTSTQLKELQQLMKYINTVNNEHHSWSSLLSVIRDETGPLTRLKDAIIEFLK